MYIEATYKSKQQIGIYVHMDVIFKSGSICNLNIDQMIHIYMRIDMVLIRTSPKIDENITHCKI